MCYSAATSCVSKIWSEAEPRETLEELVQQQSADKIVRKLMGASKWNHDIFPQLPGAVILKIFTRCVGACLARSFSEDLIPFILGMCAFSVSDTLDKRPRKRRPTLRFFFVAVFFFFYFLVFAKMAADSLVLQLSVELLKNASRALPMSFFVGIAIGIAALNNKRSPGPAVWGAALSCWPMYCFCAIVSTTFLFTTLLGAFNVLFSVLVGCARDTSTELGPPGVHMERCLILLFLLSSGMFLASLMLADLIALRNQKPLSSDVPLTLQFVFEVCNNVAKSLPLLASIACASVLTFLLNPESHRHFDAPHVIKKQWDGYTLWDAAKAGVLNSHCGFGILIFCTVFPIAWEVSFYMLLVVILIPVLVHIGTKEEKDRSHLEVNCLFWLNVVVCLVHLAMFVKELKWH